MVLYAGLELDMFGAYTFRKVGSEICPNFSLGLREGREILNFGLN